MTKGCPTIYIPGIVGSQLYLPDGKKIWLSVPTIIADPEKLDISSDLIVKNNDVNQQKKKTLEKECGVLRQNTILIEMLCKMMPSSPIYFFSYDFRKSNIETAEKLHQQIEKITASKEKSFKNSSIKDQSFKDTSAKNHSVNIICHSMGGLVTSAYIAKYGDAKINKIVMLGVPFEGAFETIRMYITGNILEFPSTITEFFGINRDMIKKYPGLAELIPTRENLLANPMEINERELSLAEMENGISSIIPDLYDDARKVQEEIRKGFETILERQNCYFVLGYGKQTLQSLSFIDNLNNPVPVESKKGDGVVSWYSSTFGGKLFPLMIENSPRVKVFPLRHSYLTYSPESVKWIVECLKTPRKTS